MKPQKAHVLVTLCGMLRRLETEIREPNVAAMEEAGLLEADKSCIQEHTHKRMEVVKREIAALKAAILCIEAYYN